MVELRQGGRIDVRRNLSYGVGHSRGRVDLKVHDGLGAEQLAELNETLEAPGRGRVAGAGRILEVLRPDADDRFSIDEAFERTPCFDRFDPELLSATERDAETGVKAHDRALEEVHRGTADEPRHEEVVRPAVELLR